MNLEIRQHIPSFNNGPLSLFLVFVFAQCSNPSVTTLPSSDKDNGGIFLPGGFEALVVVDSIGNTRHIAVNDNGDVYAQLQSSEDGKGTIAMRDLDKDGKMDSIVHFGDYIDRGSGATGLTIHKGFLYTSTKKYIFRTKLAQGELVPTGETEIVLTDMDPNVDRNWHTTKPVAFDQEGNMYVPFGSPSDACQDIDLYGPVGIPNGKGIDPCPELEKHAGIWRFDAERIGLTQEDGTKFATGIRSVVGMEWNPKDESLYAVGNGIDNFHTIFPDLYTGWQAAMLPAEVLMKVTKGSDYGWPYAYYDQIQKKNVLQPGYGGDGKIVGRASEYDEPVIAFPGHWAPMDVMFYHGDQFPKRYNNGAFVAFHGSTDRAPYPMAGFIVCFVPFDDDGIPKGTWEVFADGFAGVNIVKNTSDADYRPMGLSAGPDGSLYISESNKGKIWRVMYKGDKDLFSDEQLIAMEDRKETQSYIRDPDPVKDLIQEGDTYSGRILYNTYCTACHQGDGKGDNNRFPPLVDSEWVTGDEDRLIDIVLNGMQGDIEVNGKTYNGFMPGHDHLDNHSIASILTYVRKRFGNESSPISALKVEEIRKQSSDKK
ncbi:PQQ-dependent sugar dehydrogenase [Lunatibacter salilacus]|uniref:PQQ-dependent sugar dehydrogenase n=1 Tax=Lunatibacter salilacus TaxID=2483804 RepID=UPI00131DC31A|nr:c-type cytochrome [Lunatibacter salilacus]